MTEEKPKPNALSGIVFLLLVAGGIWYFYGGGLDKQVATDLHGIQVKVANDSVAQYEIAKRSGNKMDACVHAGIVAAAYLQAQDEGQYKKWKETEKTDCSAAGLPR